MYAFLGNHKAATAVDLLDAKGQPVTDNAGVTRQVMHAVKGKQRTEIRLPEGCTVADAFKDITNPGGVWGAHSQDGSTPKWVASDNADLATLLGAFYECEVRDPLPEGEGGKLASSAFAQSILGTLALLLWFGLMVGLRAGLVDLRTNAGTDWLSGIMGNATANPMAYMALTANATAASASDTTLTAEITTASGGLIRKAFTYAHTGGTATWTATATFTANGSDSLPVTVNKIALFNASSAGTMGFEFVVTAATFTASGDAVTYTYTITP